MNIIIPLILIAIQIAVSIYLLQQYFNRFNIKYGKVKISDKQKDGTFIESVIETNKKPSFNFIFGVPGSGKTTACSYYASVIDNMNKQLVKKGKDPLNIYANIYLKGIDYTFVDRNDIGVKKIHDGILLIDESSIDWNNRNTKNMQMYAIRYFKKHRHYNVSVFCFSQSYDDTDITLRRLADNYYHNKLMYRYLYYSYNHENHHLN